MPIIDADAHVLETDRTWSYMTESEQQYRPRIVRTTDALGAETEWWMVDGRLHSKQINVGAETSVESREMADIAARLRHMDELGIDVQVLYPTIFLRPITNRPDADLALARSYNRWLADVWAEAKGRLRWAAVLPTLSMDAALAELRWVKDHGACAVFVRGLEADRRLSDPYFFPLYEEASSLDLPICPHSGNGSFDNHDQFPDDPGFMKFKLATVSEFHALVWNDVPGRFPKLRFGFIELSAQWVPYVIHDVTRRLAKRGRVLEHASICRDNRIWVACQTDDDLSYVLQYTGDDHVIIGTDYGHNDTSSEIEALRNLKQHGDVSPAVIDKILDANARTLYGL